MTENLFDEVDSMLEVSNLIYTMAAMNNWDESVGEGQLKDPTFLEDLPKSSTEVFAWFESNRKVIQEINASKDSKRKFNLDFDQESLDRILSRDHRDMSGDATLEVLDDKFAFEGKKAEIVYAITKNPDHKRLTVIFRGSQERKDWDQNFKFRDEEVKISNTEWKNLAISSPNEEILDALDKVSIHRGFAEYLFVAKQKDGKTTKFVEIMKQLSTRLMDPEYKDYSLCFTGHSLGAALATLAAAATAIDDGIKHPVQLITFASPHVGKLDFVEALEKLEKTGRLQHLRVTNDDDSVPQALGVVGYKHAGIHLNLRNPGWFNRDTYYLERSKTRGFFTWTNNMDFSLKWFVGGIEEPHKLEEHRRRLLRAKEDLEKTSLPDLYEEPSLMDI